ncbi:hypothetical protein EHYA_07606 [Embleya hyalina]|uniref:Uncharacterized protein n=1 Tax=Embleya hyalina TaxID=516124 RepID=A0A401YZ23_9ACTN|nr:hypothetical protein EHYA_07606 [Embleya hyalina]
MSKWRDANGEHSPVYRLVRRLKVGDVLTEGSQRRVIVSLYRWSMAFTLHSNGLPIQHMDIRFRDGSSTRMECHEEVLTLNRWDSKRYVASLDAKH